MRYIIITGLVVFGIGALVAGPLINMANDNVRDQVANSVFMELTKQ